MAHRPDKCDLTILVACSLLLNAPCPGAAADPRAPGTRSLAIADAIAMAYRNNKDIQIQEREVRAARSKILGAVSGMLPKVNVEGSYTHNDAVLGGGAIDFPFESKKEIGVFTEFKDNQRVGLSIDEMLFNGGADIANTKQSVVNLRVQEETLRASRLDVEFEAKRLYYGLLLAFETERIAENLVTQARAHYDDVKKKFDGGTSSRFDLLQSAVYLSLQIPELVKAKKGIEIVMAELNKLIGQNVFSAVRPLERLGYSPIEIKEAEFLDEAYQGRPEMILKSLGIDVQKWSIEMARAGRRPQVSAGLNWYSQADHTGNLFHTRYNNWSAGASVAVPLFDGFATKAKVDEAKERYAQAVLLKEDVTDQTAVEIRRACLDLRQAEAVIISQRDSVLQAREALQISIIAYDNGVGTNLDVLDSMVALSQVEKNLASGTYDYLMALAYLDRTRGRSVTKSP